MMQNNIGNERFANIQVWREETHTDAGQAPKVAYYLGWGKDDELQGDAMTFEELQSLHALIGRVIQQNTKTE